MADEKSEKFRKLTELLRNERHGPFGIIKKPTPELNALQRQVDELQREIHKDANEFLKKHGFKADGGKRMKRRK